MEYEKDPLLPILQQEIKNRTSAYVNISAAEEQKLLSLNDAQKKAIIDQDKQTKNTYLATTPKISHAGLKAQPKFKAYEASIGGGSAH